MRISAHLEYLDAVLYQCPGEQIAELGDEIAAYAENLEVEVDIDDLRKKLRAWATAADAIEPLVEALHEIADDVDFRHDEKRVEGLRPRQFQRDIELRYVQFMVARLQATRASDDTPKAQHSARRLLHYREYGCTPLIRELAQSALRVDEADYGETPSE